MNNKNTRRIWQGPLIYLLVFAIILLVVQMLGSDVANTSNAVTLSYSELLEWVEADLKGDASAKT